MIFEVEVSLEPRPSGNPPFASLKLNGIHIWRFDRKSEADGAADNLVKALKIEVIKKEKK